MAASPNATPSGKDLPYAYAGCDPVNASDPTGRQTLEGAGSACIQVGVRTGYTTLILGFVGLLVGSLLGIEFTVAAIYTVLISAALGFVVGCLFAVGDYYLSN